MFGFSKKKKANKANEQVKNNQGFAPSFGSVEDFEKRYNDGATYMAVGRKDGKLIGLSASSAPANNIFLINDNEELAREHYILPLMKQSLSSFVIYDPTEAYYNASADFLHENGYDIQIVDLEDPEHGSRIDLFEVANITRNTYWTSLILSGSVRCNQNEILPAHNLMMAIMQYLLDTKQKITVTETAKLLQGLLGEDSVKTVEDIEACPAARQYIEKFKASDDDIKHTVCEKIYTHFTRVGYKKLRNPNIFTVAVPKKKTAVFIKDVPAQFRFLITAFLFNLKAVSVLCGDGNVNTVIVNTSEEDWYNKALLDRVCGESAAMMTRGSAVISLKSKLGKEAAESTDKILLYMHADDEDTKKLVYCYLPMDMQLSDQEKETVSQTFYKGKGVPEDVLRMAPIELKELDAFENMLVIDASRATRPFRCEKI